MKKIKMGRRTVWRIFWCLLSAGSVSAQSNRQKAEMLQQAVNKYLYEPNTGLYIQTSDRSVNHNPHADLWGLCGLIQATNEMERIHPGKAYMAPVVAAINQYYDAGPPAPGYASYVMKERKEDRYYDDNQWIGIAYLDAYTRTRKKWYLEKGEEIYRFMMTGFDTVSGGGL